MALLGQLLSVIGGLGTLICFILVVIQMFQRGQAVLGIVCILLLCCGIGTLVAFIFGWVKHREWGITNIMLMWTGFWLILVVGYVLYPVDFRQFGDFPQP